MIAPIPVLRYASIDSTNLEARRLAEQGEMGPIWIVADEQTAGRGRLGRQWHSKQGNLYSTLLFPVNASQAKAAQIAFIAALAVYDVATHFIKNPNISLKWPNDCLLDDAKFSGVLAEYIGGVPPMMALGIGMNIAHAPKGLPYPTTYLASLSPSVTVEAAHEVLSVRFQHWLKIWNDAKNFAAVKAAWEKRAINLGKMLEVDSGQTIRHGQFKGLNEDGAMILEAADKSTFIIHAGDVRLATPENQTP